VGSVFFILSVFCSTCLSLSLFYIFVHIVVCISRFSILDCLYSCIKRFCMDFTAISYEVHYINIFNTLGNEYWYCYKIRIVNIILHHQRAIHFYEIIQYFNVYLNHHYCRYSDDECTAVEALLWHHLFVSCRNKYIIKSVITLITNCNLHLNFFFFINFNFLI
jgi:hypothetical protein